MRLFSLLFPHIPSNQTCVSVVTGLVLICRILFGQLAIHLHTKTPPEPSLNCLWLTISN